MNINTLYLYIYIYKVDVYYYGMRNLSLHVDIDT